MARLIDADKRVEEIKKLYCDGCDNYGGVKCRACWVDDAMSLIDDATTVYAVEVVHCRDCKYWDRDTFSCGWDGENYYWKQEDYCSYGERKVGDEHGR